MAHLLAQVCLMKPKITDQWLTNMMMVLKVEVALNWVTLTSVLSRSGSNIKLLKSRFSDSVSKEII